jgi:hypothetical protein
MDKQHYQFFKLQKRLEPSNHLIEAILIKTAKLKKRQLFFEIGFFASIFLLAISIAVYAGFELFLNLKNSALADLLSLVWSDLPALAIYWQEFAYAIVDVLPITSLSLFFIGLVAVLVSGRFLAWEGLRLKKIINHK